MTIKEKQLKMLEALDLRVGDVVEIKMIFDTEQCKISVNPISGTIRLSSVKYLTSNPPLYDISCLLNYDFKVIKYHQKTWGESKCAEFQCFECPLQLLACKGVPEETLSVRLDKTAKTFFPKNEKGKKIYDLCKEMLDEVRDDTSRT